jgi:hypothetical protein
MTIILRSIGKPLWCLNIATLLYRQSCVQKARKTIKVIDDK